MFKPPSLKKARRSFRKKSRKPVVKEAVKAYVKKEIHRGVENKQATTYAINTRVQTQMPTSVATGIYQVIPPLEATLSGNAGRVGQQVSPRSLILNANFWLTPTLTGSAYPVYFDLYVFEVKAINDTSFDISTELGQFLRPTVLNAGADTFYEGRAQNYYQMINSDVIKILHKQRIKMSTVITNVNQGVWIDNTAQLSGDVKISLSKHLKSKFKYTNSGDLHPNNQSIYATMVCTEASAPGTPAPLAQFGACTFTSNLIYEDA